VGDGVLLQLLPFNNRRPMGGFRSVIWSGTDGRRDEDIWADGGGDFGSTRKEKHDLENHF
jgi:hypothetical protein